MLHLVPGSVAHCSGNGALGDHRPLLLLGGLANGVIRHLTVLEESVWPIAPLANIAVVGVGEALRVVPLSFALTTLRLDRRPHEFQWMVQRANE